MKKQQVWMRPIQLQWLLDGNIYPNLHIYSTAVTDETRSYLAATVTRLWQNNKPLRA